MEFDKKRVMHIDTSVKLHERRDTGISYKIVKTNEHKGFGLSIKLKKELERDLDAKYDYARIYAICIYYLIRDDFDLFDVLVICGDENYSQVKGYLDLLFSEDKRYYEKKVISLHELRNITEDKKLKSYADKISNSYRKRALKSKVRQQKGIELNPIKVNYKMVYEKWKEIDNKLDKKS